ncbi:related to FIG4 - polyphosphoinositide phosphatase family member [Melanopsichium pennsylvanicum]|uniref:Related to FIG4 - polyphosphoinositide phosphatase family member n=2 Tax=Melanopsichium pennsylvanicum TaxID=63383 RepID=A0AAJ4XJB4_9BASI|nr:related to FIG4-polyphosphoinositide phosphatase family member [Melanopsichium pennsylvanicum 4]SNX83694.1 related to FIG4 - polyphosphoinositide phosphatase family member [Melanopsichium pennsylvanicum]
MTPAQPDQASEGHATWTNSTPADHIRHDANNFPHLRPTDDVNNDTSTRAEPVKNASAQRAKGSIQKDHVSNGVAAISSNGAPEAIPTSGATEATLAQSDQLKDETVSHNDTADQKRPSASAIAPAATHEAHPSPKEVRAAHSIKNANTIPDPAVSLSASRPNMLPPPRPSMAASSFINPTPTLTPGSTWGPIAASAAAARAEAAEPGRIGDLKRFTLWETKTRFYLVAYNTSQTRFRILKVDRTLPSASVPSKANADSDVAPSASTINLNGPSQAAASVDPSSHASVSGLSSKLADAKTDSSKGGKPNAAATSADCSVRGQRYLSLDDPQICKLNRRMLDAKQIPRESGAGSSSTATGSTTKASAVGMSSRSTPVLISGTDPKATANAPVASAPKQSDTASSFKANDMNKSGAADCELNVTSDRVVYSRSQVAELLEMIREGNRATGGLHEVGRFFGIVGFIRFTSTYYMVLISRRSVVALIGGHYIYHCDETVILPVCHQSVLASLPGRTKLMEQEEARLLHLFKQVDLSKNFYFSYTYDLTKTLQDNLTSTPGDPLEQASSISPSKQPITAWGYNEKFIWNHHLLLPAFAASEHLQPHQDPRNEWVLPLVYGFVDQAKLSVLNRTVYTTLIARRSRHFAGARFLKRGIDERGHVANDVETEQIVSEALTTPFFAPGRKRFEPTDRQARSASEHLRGGSNLIRASGLREKPVLQPPSPVRDDPKARPFARKDEDDDDYDDLPLDASPRYTSYVMMRGSIPVYWTQDSSNMSPRPPIDISLVDPYYSAAALHFDELFHRYGTPIIVLNLIKSKEKQEREMKLLRTFGECTSYLNQFLPADKKIRYIAWDMSRASKAHDVDVIGILEDIAQETLETTHFFHSGPEPAAVRSQASARSDLTSDHSDRLNSALRVNGRNTTSNYKASGGSDMLLGRSARRETILLQEGVARVNCVDCLDRTNAAQFVIGKAAFGHQLHALGLLDDPSLPFDSDAVNMLTEMYHDLGDTIAMQYGGSALAHTTDTYRKINQWTSHSRDVLESMKRYYANSFADADKQAAINLFLGVNPMAPDFSPHVFPETIMVPTMTKEKNSDERAMKAVQAVPFRPHYQHWYDPLHLQPRGTIETRQRRLKEVANADAGFWAEYYRPSLFTDLNRHHAFKMTAVHQYSHLHGGVSHTSGGLGMPYSQTTGALSMYSTQIGGATDLSRHVRSDSISSLSSGTLNPIQAELMVAYPSPFKPRGGGNDSGYRGSQHGRRSLDDARSSTTQTSTTIVNDARSPVSTRSGQFHSASPTASVSAPPPSKAIIGGVRRWISINKPGGSPRLGDIRKSSKRYSIASSEGGDGNHGDIRRAGDAAAAAATLNRSFDIGPVSALHSASAAAGVGFDPHTFNFAGRWQTVNPVGPAIAGSNVAIEAALNKACNPHISEEEESEYAFYTRQFLDEYARPNGSMTNFHGPVEVAAHETRIVRPSSAALTDDHLIDEKDILIYEEGVAISDGRPIAVDRFVRYSTVDPVLVNHANAVSHLATVSYTHPMASMTAGLLSSNNNIGVPAMTTGGTAGGTATTTTTTTSEAKVRAYSSWLSLGQTKLASF